MVPIVITWLELWPIPDDGVGTPVFPFSHHITTLALVHSLLAIVLTAHYTYTVIILLLAVALIISIKKNTENVVAGKSMKDPDEIQFRSKFDKMLEGVEIIGFNRQYLYVNEAYEKQVRMPKEQLLGYTIVEKFPGIEQTDIYKAIERCLHERIPIHLVDSFTFPDNTTRWFEISFQPVSEGVFVLSNDITEYKESEDALRKSLKDVSDYKYALDESAIVSITDRDGIIKHVNENFCKVSGYPVEELIGGNHKMIVNSNYNSKPSIRDLWITMEKRMIWKGELENKSKDGSTYWLETTIVPFLDKNGEVYQYVTIQFDVTQRKNSGRLNQELTVRLQSKSDELVEVFKRTEEEMRRSEQRYRALIENSYDVLCILDKDFKPIYASPATERIMGWRDDLIREGILQVTHPDDANKLTEQLQQVLIHPGVAFPVALRMQHKNGHYLHLEGVITNMFHEESICGIVSNFRDVTEVHIAEERNKQSEKIYKTIASSIPGAVICLVDRDLRYFLVEGEMLVRMGYSKEELLGSKIRDVVAPTRFQELKPHFERVFSGESFTVENATAGFDILSKYVPFRDEYDHVFAAMVVIFDVSELKKTQRALANLNAALEDKIQERTAQLEAVNKELEAFSYSVAHDLRTPLRAIYGYSTILNEDYGDTLDAEGRRLITRVVHNAKRMGALIDDLLTFSRLGRKEIQRSRVDMNYIVESCINDLNLRESYPGTITVDDLHPVMADPSLIKYVMINLISNAVKYSSGKESPEVHISSAGKNSSTVYSIKDNGIGFDMKYADKLFGVFQRLHTSDEFEGTGAGLAVVQRIIHRHHGDVWAEGKINEGATFYISLPGLASNS